MNNMHSVWAKRFTHYIGEVMKYMRFIFTGHIAIVLVFIVGAGGYQYSEWLKVVELDFLPSGSLRLLLESLWRLADR